MSSDGKFDEMLGELKKIRELLTPAADPPPPKGMRNEFMTFLSQYKVLGLAVAFIIGLYLGAVVQALVRDLILPPISFVLGAGGGAAFESARVGPFLVVTFLLLFLLLSSLPLLSFL